MTSIYHITHIDNLPSIIQQGGLICDRHRDESGVVCKGIAHNHIKERRARRCVPVAAQGTLADYVPFYFAPRSPMLYTIDRGNVEGYQGGQNPILHLCAEVQDPVDHGLTYCFTDGHADMAVSEYFENLERLDRIDWNVMSSVYWNDTQEYPDRKRRRQAEFLVHEFFPWEFVKEIGVINGKIETQVSALLAEVEHRPAVTVRRDWYY
jgi:hypothetical protein